MNNLILALINALCIIGVFTKKEAEDLCHELHYATLSDNFKGSYIQIESILKRLEIGRKFYLEDEADHSLLKELEVAKKTETKK